MCSLTALSLFLNCSELISELLNEEVIFWFLCKLPSLENAL